MLSMSCGNDINAMMVLSILKMITDCGRSSNYMMINVTFMTMMVFLTISSVMSVTMKNDNNYDDKHRSLWQAPSIY